MTDDLKPLAFLASGEPMPRYAFDIQCREPVLRDPDHIERGYVWAPAEPEFNVWLAPSLQWALDSAVRAHQFSDHDVISVRLLSPGMSTPIYPRKGRYQG